MEPTPEHGSPGHRPGLAARDSVRSSPVAVGTWAKAGMADIGRESRFPAHFGPDAQGA
ncbi:hypothetical protein [Komagataeibacter europaeus]|uniref:hypothetical protein n=1 Tax=Komagataeibacter europaeus TaxID=33995 RepID=UPI0002E2964C|nr:hypothetical protein [Komagataeibacter europaeus]